MPPETQTTKIIVDQYQAPALVKFHGKVKIKPELFTFYLEAKSEGKPREFVTIAIDPKTKKRSILLQTKNAALISCLPNKTAISPLAQFENKLFGYLHRLEGYQCLQNELSETQIEKQTIVNDLLAEIKDFKVRERTKLSASDRRHLYEETIVAIEAARDENRWLATLDFTTGEGELNDLLYDIKILIEEYNFDPNVLLTKADQLIFEDKSEYPDETIFVWDSEQCTAGDEASLARALSEIARLYQLTRAKPDEAHAHWEDSNRFKRLANYLNQKADDMRAAIDRLAAIYKGEVEHKTVIETESKDSENDLIAALKVSLETPVEITGETSDAEFQKEVIKMLATQNEEVLVSTYSTRVNVTVRDLSSTNDSKLPVTENDLFTVFQLSNRQLFWWNKLSVQLRIFAEQLKYWIVSTWDELKEFITHTLPLRIKAMIADGQAELMPLRDFPLTREQANTINLVWNERRIDTYLMSNYSLDALHQDKHDAVIENILAILIAETKAQAAINNIEDKKDKIKQELSKKLKLQIINAKTQKETLKEKIDSTLLVFAKHLQYKNVAELKQNLEKSPIVNIVQAVGTHLPYQPYRNNPVYLGLDVVRDFGNVFRHYSEKNPIIGMLALAAYSYGAAALLAPEAMAAFLAKIELSFANAGIPTTQTLGAVLGNGTSGQAIAAGFTYWKGVILIGDFDKFTESIIELCADNPVELMVISALMIGIGELATAGIPALEEEIPPGPGQWYGKLLIGAKLGAGIADAVYHPHDSVLGKIGKWIFNNAVIFPLSLILLSTAQAIRFHSENKLISAMCAASENKWWRVISYPLSFMIAWLPGLGFFQKNSLANRFWLHAVQHHWPRVIGFPIVFILSLIPATLQSPVFWNVIIDKIKQFMVACAEIFNLLIKICFNEVPGFLHIVWRGAEKIVRKILALFINPKSVSDKLFAFVFRTPKFLLPSVTKTSFQNIAIIGVVFRFRPSPMYRAVWEGTDKIWKIIPAILIALTAFLFDAISVFIVRPLIAVLDFTLRCTAFVLALPFFALHVFFDKMILPIVDGIFEKIQGTVKTNVDAKKIGFFEGFAFLWRKSTDAVDGAFGYVKRVILRKMDLLANGVRTYFLPQNDSISPMVQLNIDETKEEEDSMFLKSTLKTDQKESKAAEVETNRSKNYLAPLRIDTTLFSPKAGLLFTPTSPHVKLTPSLESYSAVQVVPNKLKGLLRQTQSEPSTPRP